MINLKKIMLFLHARAVFLTCLYLVSSFLLSCTVPSAKEPTVINGIQQPVIVKAQQPDPVEVKVAVPDVPKVSAAAAIVYDPKTGKVLFEKNARQRRAVASTQKLLTALLAIEFGLDKTVTVPSGATKVVPSKLYLEPGTNYTISHLVEAMLVRSGNDVAYTIGHGVSGTHDAFITRMNERAKELGMFNSNFINSHGLTAAGQYSTAYDIALLGAAAYKYDFVKNTAKKKELVFKYANGREKILYNTNKLLGRVAYCDGLKTGTTKASGNCLVSSGALNGKPIIVVVLGASSKDLLWKDSEALLRWGLE